VKPSSGQCKLWLSDNMGLSIVESLDTMLIMGLDDMFERGTDYLKKKLDWNQNFSVSLFEVTIRCLGGLLSVYQLTDDEFFLKSATELGNRLLPAFDDAAQGIPYNWIHLTNPKKKSYSDWNNGRAMLAEIGSLQMEFALLANMTNEEKFYTKPMNVYKYLIKIQPADNLYPNLLSPTGDNDWELDGDSGVGAWSDSFYEYILKYWILTGKKNKIVKKWYQRTADAIIKHLTRKIEPDLIYVGTLYRPSMMDHLSCFSGGMFMLGIDALEKEQIENHTKIAKGLAKFCHEMYTLNPTGLPCDIIDVTQKKIYCQDFRYRMRPEAVETWFYMYRLTGEKKYRDWGWEFYKAIELNTQLDSGYGGLYDASSIGGEIIDTQESYFLAETLKYLYLLFSPNDVVPIDKFVFNTEGHVFPIISEFVPFEKK